MLTIADWLAIGGSLTTLIVVWWRVTKDSEMTQAKLDKFDKELENLKVYKANTDTVAKLAELVAELDKLMISHHTDHRLHRTEDSEKRMEDLVRNFEAFAKQNREDHVSIMQKIEAKTYHER